MSKFRTIQKKSDSVQSEIKKESIIINNMFLSDVLNIIYAIKSKRNEEKDKFDSAIYIHL